jgi:putative aldouronate transport system permease protein
VYDVAGDRSIAALPARRRRMRDLWNHRYLYLMALPGLIYFAIFCYLPMVGIFIAFKNYTISQGIWGSPWIGLQNFEDFFQSAYFGSLLRNTILINLLKLVVGFPFTILFALLLNEVGNRYFKRVVQTVSYFPYFLSWVVAVLVFQDLLAPDGFLLPLLQHVGVPADVLDNESWFYPLVVLTAVWKGYGYGAILYLAGIANANPQLYEAAMVDGAGRLRQAWHITLPAIRPIIVLLLILNVGQLLNADFQQLLALLNGRPDLYDVGDVIDTYVYRYGLLQAQYSYAAAVGVFKGVISFALVWAANIVAKRLGQEGLW